MSEEELVDLIARRVHDAWMETKLDQGVTSRVSSDGIEQMVPYHDLPEHLKELDRATVRATLAGIRQLGGLVVFE